MPKPTVSYLDPPAHIASIKYDGHLADLHAINLLELTTSLNGFDTVIRLAVEAEFRREFGTPADGVSQSVQIDVVAIEGGSFTVGLGLAIGAGLWVSEKIATKLFDAAWAKALAVVREYLRAKREGRTLSEFAEELELAVSYWSTDPEVSNSVAETTSKVELAQTIDRSLASATYPIGRTSTSIVVTPSSGLLPISFGIGERRLCAQPFPVPAPQYVSSDTVLRRIRLLGININGWGRFNFEDPLGTEETHQQDCKITDSTLAQQSDPYTLSLAMREPIDVWLKRVTRQSSDIGSHYWEIVATTGYENLPLLGHN